MADDGKWGRRSLLRGAAVLGGAAATAPLLGGVAPALAGGDDADALFKAGKFEKAARAYEEILRRDPKNLRAARQRGHVGLLSNRFPDAEKYLKMAVDLAPDDKEANELLGDCYIRQDKFALSVPCWRAAGAEDYAKWFAAISGEPYRMVGDIGRARFQQMDPRPLVEASVNGGPAKSFSFYTGTSNLSLTASVAKEAGLNPVVSQKSEFEGISIWVHYGVLDSFKLGGIELRNVPVGWSSTESGEDVDADSDGLIGTWVFYHLLTTFDYAGRHLILRRRTPEAVAEVRAAAVRAGSKPLPIWLSRDHDVSSVGSIAGSGPRVMGVNFGGVGEIAVGMPGEVAKRLRVRTDYDRPIETFAHSHPTITYPCYPREIRLGDAVARDVYCEADPNMPLNVPWPYGSGIDGTGHFAHCFFKPYNITLDFTDMNLYIVRGKAD
ncbi:tetratricopeptide repeat protein [Spongiactinospora sp. TRM90649]|uniref:tetratricopeptide repeat protein n=1 Tax=Spongiactinospora sp. TRM90649 TaxID=3031114 RepID=UPI0023F6BF3F|nr:tetratricopeptide repeat protein [Spongiactinospora sp. TRM90649]MDF5758026.1 tetratricopeptide repeat protein [Spongiactinospora sp. TRM90649]